MTPDKKREVSGFFEVPPCQVDRRRFILRPLTSLFLFSFCLSNQSVSRDNYVIDATDGIAATLEAFLVTDYRIIIIWLVLMSLNLK